MTLDRDETGEPYALERDEKVWKKAKSHGVEIRGFARFIILIIIIIIIIIIIFLCFCVHADSFVSK